MNKKNKWLDWVCYEDFSDKDLVLLEKLKPKADIYSQEEVYCPKGSLPRDHTWDFKGKREIEARPLFLLFDGLVHKVREASHIWIQVTKSTASHLMYRTP